MAAGKPVKDTVRRVEDRDAASFAYEQDVYPAGEEAATEFSRHVFQAIWAARMAMLAGLVTAIVLGIGVLILYRMSRPLVTTYSTAITLTMPGAAERRYPNGMPFAVTDILSPAVLESVFRSNGLDQYGIGLADFSAMVTVSSETPALETANQRYRERLSRKALTFEEQKAIEAAFADEILKLSSSGAIISVAVSDKLGVPANIGRKLPHDIAAQWADLYINRLGAAGLPVSASGMTLVDDTFVKTLDYPLAYDFLVSKVDDLRMRLKQISVLPGVGTYLDPATGKSISDLSAEMEVVDAFAIKRVLNPLVETGLSRDPAMADMIYRSLADSYRAAEKAALERARAIETAIRDIEAKAEQASPGADSAGQPLAITQFDSAFVDRIIALAKTGDSAAFRRKLLEDKLDMENAAISASQVASRLDERRRAIAAYAASGGETERLGKTFSGSLADAGARMNAIWREADAILGQFNTKQLNFDKTLYQSASLGNAEAMAESPYMTQFMATILAAFAFAGLFIGLVGHVVLRVFSGKLP